MYVVYIYTYTYIHVYICIYIPARSVVGWQNVQLKTPTMLPYPFIFVHISIHIYLSIYDAGAKCGRMEECTAQNTDCGALLIHFLIHIYTYIYIHT